MRRLIVLFGLTALAAGPAVAQKAMAPELLRKALTEPASSKQLFAYDFEDVSSGSDGKEAPRNRTVRGRIDPSRPKGERVTITHLEGVDDKDKPLDPKKIDKQYEERADNVGFCDTFSEPNPPNVVDKGSTPLGRAFSFTPKPEKDADGEMKAIAKKVLAQVYIDEATGLITSFNAKLMKPHNVMLVADVKAFDLTTTCAPASNGRAYSARTEMRMSLSALGRNVLVNSVQIVSNLVPVG